MGLTIISDFTQLSLYVRHMDKMILKSFIIALVFSLLGNLILIYRLDLLGAAISKVITLLALILSRLYFLITKNKSFDLL